MRAFVLLLISALATACATTARVHESAGHIYDDVASAKNASGGSPKNFSAFVGDEPHQVREVHREKPTRVCLTTSEQFMFGHDALGSPVFRVTSTGTTTTLFDAWGAIRSTPPTGPPVALGENQTGFTGHNNDLESGLVYARARYLDPSTGRFLSLDPVAGILSDPLSTQGFIYTHGSPTRYVDPAGTCVVWSEDSGFSTEFKGCGKAAAGYAVGVGKVAAAPGILAYNFTGAALHLLTGGSQYLKQADATGALVQGIVDLATSPKETVKAAASSLAHAVMEKADQRDYFRLGEVSGEVAGTAVVAGAAAGSAASGLRNAAKVGERIADAAAAGFAEGVYDVGTATTRASRAAAAGGATRALPAARQIEAAWGASTYRHGGLMTGMEHIMYRHSAGSGFANVSRYAQGTTARNIVGYVDDALRYGTVTPNGAGYMVEHNLGRVIGTNIAGDAASSIRVFVRDGVIQTAFPF